MKDNPHIWLLCSRPLWQKDGYTQRVSDELNNLRKQSLDVGLLVIVPLRTIFKRSHYLWLKNERKCGASIMQLVNIPDFGLKTFRRLSTFALERRIRYLALSKKIVCIHAHGIRAASLTSLVASDLNIVVDIHGNEEAETELVAKKHASRAMKNRLLWVSLDSDKAFQNASKFIVVSEGMADWLQERTNVGSRTPFIVPCAVNVKSFVFNAKDHAKNDSIRVCYMGGLQDYQSPEIIAEAAKKISLSGRKIAFWVITPKQHERVKQAFSRYDLDVKIESMTRASIYKNLCLADIGIIPRRPSPVNSVACPTKIGEYLAAGVPVMVSSAIGMLAKEISDTNLGICLEDSDEALSHFLDQVSAKRDWYRTHCREAALTTWSWEFHVKTIYNIYSECGVLDNTDSETQIQMNNDRNAN